MTRISNAHASLSLPLPLLLLRLPLPLPFPLPFPFPFPFPLPLPLPLSLRRNRGRESEPLNSVRRRHGATDTTNSEEKPPNRSGQRSDRSAEVGTMLESCQTNSPSSMVLLTPSTIAAAAELARVDVATSASAALALVAVDVSLSCAAAARSCCLLMANTVRYWSHDFVQQQTPCPHQRP